jgi:hypothetical protein
MTARYDAAAGWYDAYVTTGAGRPFALAALGWRTAGVDISTLQVALARRALTRAAEDDTEHPVPHLLGIAAERPPS